MSDSDKSKPQSPCKRLARTNKPSCRRRGDICIDCGRSITEIVTWNEYSDEEKQKILNRLEKEGYINTSRQKEE